MVNSEKLEASNKIDGVWPLEGFVSQKNAEASNKFGFIGIGQGGSKVVDAFAGIRSPRDGEPVYKCLIINSNLGDMRPLKNIPPHLQFSLKGYEKGVGKNPDVGREAFEANGAEIFDAISRYMEDRDFIYVSAALGGGTGTGSINVLVDAIADYLGKPVAAIASLPRPDEVESLNAYNAMVELIPKLNVLKRDDYGNSYRNLENVILLDNEKIVQDHTTNPEVQGITWDYYSNYKVASILHEWNVVTSLESDITLDSADLTNHILKSGGVLTFAKKKINLDDIKSRDHLLTEITSTYKGKNVLANGFNYKNDIRNMALVVVMPRERTDMLNQDTLEILRSTMKDELPDIGFYPGFATHHSKRHAIVYTMASMAGLPERARNMRQEAEELLAIRKKKEEQASGFSLGEKIAHDRPISGPRRTGVNPFDRSSEQQVAATRVNPFEKPKSTNPFRKE